MYSHSGVLALKVSRRRRRDQLVTAQVSTFRVGCNGIQDIEPGIADLDMPGECDGAQISQWIVHQAAPKSSSYIRNGEDPKQATVVGDVAKDFEFIRSALRSSIAESASADYRYIKATM